MDTLFTIVVYASAVPILWGIWRFIRRQLDTVRDTHRRTKTETRYLYR